MLSDERNAVLYEYSIASRTITVVRGARSVTDERR